MVRMLIEKRALAHNGLRYVNDQEAGIARRRHGRGFHYVRAESGKACARRDVDRIKTLVIPPAWEDVWICRDGKGHVQATGIDQKGRKQYLYHEAWARVRNEAKFSQMREFGEALPKIRAKVNRLFGKKSFDREKVLACVVSLLDKTLIRVGNDEYKHDNESHGLTTIERTHATVNGKTVEFRFRGKSGKLVEASVEDQRIARIVRTLQELPGQELFQYKTSEGEIRDVTSTDVNEFLRACCDCDVTAKDFRTWGGTVAAAEAFCRSGPACDENGASLSKTELKRRETAAVKAAAEALGNNVSTSRKFYVHPLLVQWYIEGKLSAAFEKARRKSSPRGLRVAERAVLELLQETAC